MAGETVLWRLSMADVGVDGPFSGFPGLTRVLTVIDGSGMILHGPEGDLRADYALPVVFDGGTPITAELTQGPLRDFNLMYDTARYDGDVTAVHGPTETIHEGPGQTFVVHCVAGKVRLGDADRLDAGDTMIKTCAPIRLSLDQNGIALYIRLRPRA